MSGYLLQHPLSAAFPAMSPEERESLKEDIEKHGLRHPVVSFEGRILDGWHRYQACLDSGREPSIVEYDGDDARAFVISQNAHRRQLTQGQKAAAILEISAWKPEGRPSTNNSAPGAQLLANEAGVSVRTLKHAKKARDAGYGEAVKKGEASAKTAASVAGLPKAERKRVEKLPPEDWAEALAKKPSAQDEATLEQAAAAAEEAALGAERMADLADELEGLRRIVESDDKLAAAFAEVKTWREKYAQLERLYENQRGELATMTKEAKRHARRADALEKSRKGAA